jgi:hypothetical protein
MEKMNASREKKNHNSKKFETVHDFFFSEYMISFYILIST